MHTLFGMGGKIGRSAARCCCRSPTRGGQAVSFFLLVLLGFNPYIHVLVTTLGVGCGERLASSGERFARIYRFHFSWLPYRRPACDHFFSRIHGFAYGRRGEGWHRRPGPPRLPAVLHPRDQRLEYAGLVAFHRSVLYAVFSHLSRLLGAGRFVACWVSPSRCGQFRSSYTRSSPIRIRLISLVPGCRRSGEVFLRSVCLSFSVSRPVASCCQADCRPTRSGSVGQAHSPLLLVLLLPVCAGVLPATVVETTLGALPFALVILTIAAGALPTPRWLSSSTFVLLGRASATQCTSHINRSRPFFMAAAHWAGSIRRRLLCRSRSCSPLEHGIGLFRRFEDPLRRSDHESADTWCQVAGYTAGSPDRAPVPLVKSPSRPPRPKPVGS